MTAEARARVARNVLAAETATDVPCPYCGQGVGEACVTAGARPNEAAFTHQRRIKVRWAQLG